ncbi:YerC/YecD family TrpR-related protein [Brochothrix thermosphacta]|uniref:YerC/YecD family TrpR-related protein n=1 Tax=Brochothrix thermosphacta TaxID=2756 RepID=UPI00083F83E9|nr:YerC/YecD family TrpR-related protein [Brochothrix thermosphacta]ODJ62690.1 hypothetical protein BFR35_01955 [Brochothrix thermosphacta]
MQIEKLRGEGLDEFFQAVLTLKDLEECYHFFDDVCTVNEIQALSQRFQVAKMLRRGSTYSKIEEATGASTATISRVKRSLNWGNDSYELVMSRLEENKKAENK